MPVSPSCTSRCAGRSRPSASALKERCAVTVDNAFSIVDIRQLRKRYGSNEVLKGVDLDVKRGEVIAIIGKSGSGKSTLLRCINGLEEFQEGTLQVDGQPLKHD